MRRAFRSPPSARYTENAQDLKIGDGLWGTLTGWGSYKLYIDDPEDGSVAYVGVTDEAGMPGLLVDSPARGESQDHRN